jgi:predicted glycoside hydrolase/deacetylase ChbG (UPF0249 family)
MKIITNADDFGYDADTARATIECLDSGSLTSASIMVNMPASAEAIAYAKRNPRKSFGIHLTFVTDSVEAPLSPPSSIRDLIGPDGKFLPSQTVRLRALLRRIPVDQIEREMYAQIAFLWDHGVKVSHVDSHGHVHKFAPFRLAMAKVLPRFKIARVRGVQDVYLRKPVKSPTFWFGPAWRRAIARSFKTTQHFYMPRSAGDTAAWPEAVLQRVNGRSLEIGVHPGYAEAWRNEEREAVRVFAEIASKNGIDLVSWNEL